MENGFSRTEMDLIERRRINSPVERVVNRIYVLRGYEGRELHTLAQTLVDDAKREHREEDLRWILREALKRLSD